MDQELVGEDPGGLAEDEAEWSRAWEWPDWMRGIGANARELRGWRPDGRTFAVAVAFIEGAALATLVPLVSGLWRAVFTTPEAIGSFGVPPAYTWERLIAGAELLGALGGALVVLAAAIVLLAPRRLVGYAVLVAGLATRALGECGIVVAGFKLDQPVTGRVGYIVSVVIRIGLVAFAVFVARRRAERIPFSPSAP